MISTDAMTLFLALDPDETTARRILECKRTVRELAGDQLYLGDPPHLTMYVAKFHDADDVVAAAKEMAQQCVAPEIMLAGWHTFEADPLTGGNTLVFDFEAESQRRLRALQQWLVERLADKRDAEGTFQRLSSRLEHLSASQQAAAREWGFPYVGAGWHPHFTVASISRGDWGKVAAALLADSPVGPASCPRLKVYELIDNHPVELAAFDLAARAVSRSHERTVQLPSFSRRPAPSREIVPSEAGRSLPTLKDDITDGIWSVVEQYDWILSATITGSFLTDETLRAISDIDLVLIVDHLNGPRFDRLHEDFTAVLAPVLAQRGLNFKINPTLGPRKLNDDSTAVLHLMLYSREGHHQHAIKSPFTCLDWQRSGTFRKESLAAVYPVFGLQPHHFVSSRRGIRDYLHDFERGVVSYRELECSEAGYQELKREEPMEVRDRYEYAYHVMRFLMQNLLKLVRRRNAAPDGDLLLREFFSVFPRNAQAYGPLYLDLRTRKKSRDFSEPIPQLSELLRQFVLDFESQFRVVFIETATRHIVFRHAATKLNSGHGDQRRFVGRINPDIVDATVEQLAELVSAVADFSATTVYSSPLLRCRQSLDLLASHLQLPHASVDERIAELDYGDCDGLSVREARELHPATFAAWQRGEDARFPRGENTADVVLRLNSFADEAWTRAKGNTVTCTHNVVLRCLLGETLGVPQREWHRIQVPHLAPITLIETREFGRFVDLPEGVERPLFADFLHRQVA